MVINENLLKYIFNKKQLLKYIGTLLIMVFAVFTIIVVSNVYILENNVKLNKQLIKNAYIPEDSDFDKWLEIKCNTIKCEYMFLEDGRIYKVDVITNNIQIVDDSELYNNNNNNNNKFYLIDYLTPEFDLKIDYNHPLYGNIIFVIKSGSYIESILDTMNCIFIILVLFFTITFIRTQYINYKNDIFEKGSYKLYTENKIQTNISEMINHELSAPVAILKSISYVIRELVYQQSAENISEEKAEVLDSFDFAITRIDSIINLLSINKKIQRNNFNALVHINELIDNTVTSLNNLHVVKLEHTIEDNDLLNRYVIDKLQVGDFLNILHVLLTNAVEAGASHITFSASRCYGDKLNIFVKDNGRGIRNSSGKIIKNKNIFEWGYSSKNGNGEHVIDNRWYIKLLSKLGISIIKTDTNRGIGLYVNKILLESYGGSIELFDTSSNGTTFKLKVPVK